MDEEIKVKFFKIFFKQISRDHPSALQLVRVMPEFVYLLTQPNQLPHATFKS